MSHFFTIVILPKDRSIEISSEVAKLLDPFEEGPYNNENNKEIAKWDWWRIGGRWDGIINGKEAESKDNGFNFDSRHEVLENNKATTDFLFENKIIPFAIVTPDGKWHEKANMGWWDLVKDEKEQISWDEEALEIYKSLEGYIAVGCDLHI